MTTDKQKLSEFNYKKDDPTAEDKAQCIKEMHLLLDKIAANPNANYILITIDSETELVNQLSGTDSFNEAKMILTLLTDFEEMVPEAAPILVLFNALFQYMRARKAKYLAEKKRRMN